MNKKLYQLVLLSVLVYVFCARPSGRADAEKRIRLAEEAKAGVMKLGLGRVRSRISQTPGQNEAGWLREQEGGDLRRDRPANRGIGAGGLRRRCSGQRQQSIKRCEDRHWYRNRRWRNAPHPLPHLRASNLDKRVDDRVAPEGGAEWDGCSTGFTSRAAVSTAPRSSLVPNGDCDQ